MKHNVGGSAKPINVSWNDEMKACEQLPPALLHYLEYGTAARYSAYQLMMDAREAGVDLKDRWRDAIRFLCNQERAATERLYGPDHPQAADPSPRYIRRRA